MSESLLNELRTRGDLAADAPPPAEEHAEEQAEVHVDSRWVLALQIAGGWLAAIFLLIFLGAGTAPFVHSASGWLSVGVLLTISASLGLRREGGTLYRQFLLVLSLAGQGAVLFGLADWKHGGNSQHWVIFAAFEALVFLTVAWAPHRLLAAYAAFFSLSLAGAGRGYVPDSAGMLPFIAIYWAAACLLSLSETRWRARPYAPALTLVAAALAINVVQFCCTTLYRPFSPAHTFQGLSAGWLLVAVSGLALLALGRQIWQGSRALLAALLLVAVLVLTWRAPGVAVALAALALGFQRGRRWLMWTGGALALVALNRFYYDLQIDLLEKSGLLVLGGVLVLALRWLLVGAELKAETRI